MLIRSQYQSTDILSSLIHLDKKAGLSLFKNALPTHILGLDNMGNRRKSLPKEMHYKRTWLQHRNQYFSQMIIVDLDHEYLYEKIKYAGLPLPNLVIKNKENGRSHLVFILKEGVFFRDRNQATWLYDYVKRSLTNLYSGDHSYNNTFVKNPMHENFDPICLNTTPFNMTELREELDMIREKEVGVIGAVAVPSGMEGNRNWDTYRYLQKASHYIRKNKKDVSGEALTAQLTEYAYRSPTISNHKGQLSHKEITGIVKSVVKSSCGVWTKYDRMRAKAQLRKEKGAIGRQTQTDRSNRKSLTALTLWRDGVKSYSKLSVMLGCSRRHVANLLKRASILEWEAQKQKASEQLKALKSIMGNPLLQSITGGSGEQIERVISRESFLFFRSLGIFSPQMGVGGGIPYPPEWGGLRRDTL